MFGKKKDDTKLIKFGMSDDRLEMPQPMRTVVPDWYKKSPRFIEDKQPRVIETERGLRVNHAMKLCVPFFDAMIAGYTAVLWQDIEVVRTPEGPHFNWLTDPQPITERSDHGMELLPTPAGHWRNKFVWISPYSLQTPPGYSVLVTHPLNRHDLPFITLSGIHDSDSLMPHGHLPFYLREDFEGIIPKGTPIYQIFPFKRDNWDSVLDEEVSKKAHKRGWEGITKMYGHYKDNNWKKKEYR